MNSDQTIFAFIDSQNLNLGIKNDIIDNRTGKLLYKGWKLDYRKFKLYLKNKYGVTKAYLFIGHVPGNEKMYTNLQEMGFILVFKPTLPVNDNGKKTMKGNVDAELVLWASAATYKDYDKAIIVSGDGDFLCLIEYLAERDKLLKVLAPNMKYSSLLNKYASYIVRLDQLKSRLEY